MAHCSPLHEMPLKVKRICISIGLCNIAPTFTWYRIDTRTTHGRFQCACGNMRAGGGKMFTYTVP